MTPKWAAKKRDFMISVGFQRVSKKRPCRICGKPTYCGFSRDEGTSICMRISPGSRGFSRNGGNIHVHTEIPFITIQPRIMRPISQSIPLASPEIRDAVFRELIKISPASNYREELVKQRDKTPVQIDELVAQAKKRYTTGIIYLTVFGYLITGAVITAVGSAILMRRK